MTNAAWARSGLQPDLSFEHLQLELARIDVFLHRQLVGRAHGQAGQAQATPEWSALFMTATEAAALLQQPLGANGGNVETQVEDAYVQALSEIETQIDALRRHAEETGQLLRLQQLAEHLHLRRHEVDVLLIALAPAVDLKYAKLYAFLQDNLTQLRPTVNLVLDLMAPDGQERILWLNELMADNRLWRYQIVQRSAEPENVSPLWLRQALMIDATLVRWLISGLYQLPVDAPMSLRYTAQPSPELPLLSLAQQQICAELTQGADRMLMFYGPDELPQEVAAAYFAHCLKKPLFQLDLTGADLGALSTLHTIQRCLRDATITNAVVFLRGWDSESTEDQYGRALLDMLDEHSGPVILAGRTEWQPQHMRRRRLSWMAFPLPDYQQRRRVFEHFLANHDLDMYLDLNVLIGQFALSTNQMRGIVYAAMDAAAQEEHPLQERHLLTAARHLSNPRLAKLARKITPRYTWTDIILPPDQVQILHEMVNTVRQRPKVLGDWAIGKKLAASAGVTALFAGPPGTGKTMASEVMAANLGLDLYKIDLSSMVSKYIGETEKNLERIFSEAESSNAILFFDEADAIFGKRSEVRDAHDRYANIEISYLLQRMESYNGVTILATNLRANLDEAFLRRIQFMIDFPFPEVDERLRIWQGLFPAEVPRVADLDFASLAERFKLTGSNIRNVIVGAAYLAASQDQPVNMHHLLHATKRELQKMGRMVSEHELKM